MTTEKALEILQEVKDEESNKAIKQSTLETKQIRPQHYKDCSIECIDNMLLVFGVKETMDFCCMNAYKYLYRHLYKSKEQDIQKAATYIALCENIWEKYNDYDMPEQYYVLEKLVNTELDKYKNGEY